MELGWVLRDRRSEGHSMGCGLRILSVIVVFIVFPAVWLLSPVALVRDWCQPLFLRVVFNIIDPTSLAETVV